MKKLKLIILEIMDQDNMNTVWTNYPESSPAESGYYYTYYFNPQLNEELYKSLWYDTKTNKWIGPWRWSYTWGPDEFDINGKKFNRIFHHGLDVKKYVADSRTDYYTQSQYPKE